MSIKLGSVISRMSDSGRMPVGGHCETLSRGVAVLCGSAGLDVDCRVSMLQWPVVKGKMRVAAEQRTIGEIYYEINFLALRVRTDTPNTAGFSSRKGGSHHKPVLSWQSQRSAAINDRVKTAEGME